MIYLLVFTCIGVSCTQVRDIAYFQQTHHDQTVIRNVKHDARIKPKDLLSINVISSEPAAVKRYNLIAPQTDVTMSYIQSQPVLQNYLVDSSGEIVFPSLGKMQVRGLTTKELEDSILVQLKPFFTEEMPVINVRIMNYSVSVLGEVNRPGKFESPNGRMNIFEGLAMAGDLTIYGRRNNVKVLRENREGKMIVYTLNLSDKKIFESPVFFLEQNDVVYVEPNTTKANSSKFGAAESFGISALSIMISMVTLGVTIFRSGR